MDRIIIKEDVRLPGTKIILEKGDIIMVIKEAETTIGIPSDKLTVPYDIPLTAYGSESSGMINKGTEVRYKVDITESGFLVTLFYNHLKHLPFQFSKVPILFASQTEAEAKGWCFDKPSPLSIMNTIPSGTEINGAVMKEAKDIMIPIKYRDFLFGKMDIRQYWDFEFFVNKVMRQIHDSSMVDFVQFNGVTAFDKEDGAAELSFTVDTAEMKGTKLVDAEFELKLEVRFNDNMVNAWLEDSRLQMRYSEVPSYQLKKFDGEKMVEELISFALSNGVFDGIERRL